MSVAIIDYGSGNLRSAQKSLERAAATVAGRPQKIAIVHEAERLKEFDRVVLPGVGAFADCATGLKALDGMWEAIEEHVLVQGRPFLGICVGMQLMAQEGLEHGSTAGFGWVPGRVEPIPKTVENLRIPHMGWNTVEVTNMDHPIFADIEAGENGWHAYFVHSYHFKPDTESVLLAETEYGSWLTAAVVQDNMIGTQFHPEKSQRLGLKFLENFLTWAP